jgi:hypothetical protein
MTKRKRIFVADKKSAEKIYTGKKFEDKEKKSGFLISISFINERRNNRAVEIADYSLNRLCMNAMKKEMVKLQVKNNKYES